MKKKNNTTEKLVVTALMIALTVVLSKLLSINISILRIGFGFLPIAVLAILYGPLASGIAYAIADIIGSLLFPTGDFFPGFTVSAFITGIIFGAFLYRKEITIVRAAAASALVCILVNLLLNTYWLTFFVGKAYGVLIASRIVKELVAVPVMSILIKAVDRAVVSRFISRPGTV